MVFSLRPRAAAVAAMIFLSLARRGPELRIEESSLRAVRGAPLRSRARATGVARAYRRRRECKPAPVSVERRPQRARRRSWNSHRRGAWLGAQAGGRRCIN